MTSYYCEKCGYRSSTWGHSRYQKSDCVWCNNKEDTLNILNEQVFDHMHQRFTSLKGKARTSFVIAMGLEGFTVDEISTMTNMSQYSIYNILQQADVIRMNH